MRFSLLIWTVFGVVL